MVYAESTQSNSGLHRVYTEQIQSTQNLHRAIWGLHRVYTEQCRPTQGLHRTIWGLHRIYTEQYRTTQSLHRLIQCLHRVYTEQYSFSSLHCKFFGCRKHDSQSCSFPGCNPDVEFTSGSHTQLSDVMLHLIGCSFCYCRLCCTL